MNRFHIALECRRAAWMALNSVLYLIVAALLLPDRIALSADTESDPAKAWRQSAVNRRRRIIFNNDGNEPVTLMKKPSAEELLRFRTTPLIGSQVDSIFYCPWSSGFSVFTHFTKVGQVFTSQEGRYADNQMSALLKEGIDPFRVIVDFCKQNKLEIFWSMRMNDTHDASSADYGPILFRANKLKNEHPEYLLGTEENRSKFGAWTAVDYERPEIRDLAFKYIEEVCLNYDIDGIELDFFRHPAFFKTTYRGELATDDQRAAMTDLLRRVRSRADEIGRKRGRPILIAVRTPDSVPYCRDIGLDLEAWLSSDLIDLFIPAGYFQLNDWDYSVKLAHKHGVKVYPSLDEPRVKDDSAKQSRATLLGYCGRAADAWASGVDGIYLFNYFDPNGAILRTVGDPVALAKQDKDYFASIRGRVLASGGNLPYQSYQNIETLNPGDPKTLTPGETATARFQLGETTSDIDSKVATLRLRFASNPNTTHLAVTLNSNQLDSPTADENWLTYKVRLSDLNRGNNEITLKFSEQAPQSLKWLDLILEERNKK